MTHQTPKMLGFWHGTFLDDSQVEGAFFFFGGGGRDKYLVRQNDWMHCLCDSYLHNIYLGVRNYENLPRMLESWMYMFLIFAESCASQENLFPPDVSLSFFVCLDDHPTPK